MPHPTPLDRLDPFDPETGDLTVVVETPKGSRSKYAHDPRTNGFELRHVLPAGTHFPFDFGFVPSTRAGDGDPLDVLVLLDAPGFPGLVLRARLVGVIEAEQGEAGEHGEGETVRNDRIIAVASRSRDFAGIARLEDLPGGLVAEIEGFFEHDNRLRGKRFRLAGRGGPEAARRLVEEAADAARRGGAA